MAICGIYKIVCTVNKRIYIGQSTDITERWKDHTRRLTINKHDNRYLQNAWNKYGEDSFIFSVVEACKKDFDLLNAREIYWINHYETLKRSKGFNINSGGGNGYSLAGMTEEERRRVYEKIGETRSKKYRGENHPNYGKPMSVEQKAKISNSLKGPKNYYYGKKRTEHSLMMTGSGNPRSKKVVCINTGEVFDCAKYAGNIYNTTNSNILKCCRHRQAYAGKANGERLIWMYYEEYTLKNTQ